MTGTLQKSTGVFVDGHTCVWVVHVYIYACMHTINTYPCTHNYRIQTKYRMAKSTASLKTLQSPFALRPLSSPITLQSSEPDLHFDSVTTCISAPPPPQKKKGEKKTKSTSLKTSPPPPPPPRRLPPSPPKGAPCISSSPTAAGTARSGPRGCGEAVSTTDRSRCPPAPPRPPFPAGRLPPPSLRAHSGLLSAVRWRRRRRLAAFLPPPIPNPRSPHRSHALTWRGGKEQTNQRNRNKLASPGYAKCTVLLSF